MAEVLFVSKPVVPPWNDSSKGLVRDLSANLERYDPVFVRHREVVGFSPSIRAKIDVFRHLLCDATPGLWHFFFAPNRKASSAARFASRLRRAHTVHTVCSLPPEAADPKRLVFANRTVVLSRWARDRFLASGVDRSALHLIPPSTAVLARPTADERASLRQSFGLPASATLWIYPGDLEYGGGAEVAVEGFAAWGRMDALLLMACRNKTPKAKLERGRLSGRVARLGISQRVRWVGETPRIHALLGASDLVVLPNQSPYAKMDYPLVALEAMSMGMPVFVGDGTPAAELAEDGGAIAVETRGPALADAVERLTADRTALESLAIRAEALVADRFAPRPIAAKYERLYGELDAA